MSIVLPAVMTRDEAERISTRIGLRLDTIGDNYVAVMPMIREAIERQAYAALGYKSHGAYAQDRFGDALAKVGVELRREIVRELAEAGMSVRAIAPIVGTSHMTVSRDLAPVTPVTPAETAPPVGGDEDGRSPSTTGEWSPDDGFLNEATGEVTVGDIGAEIPTPEPRTVTGVDGKTYNVPAEKPAPRRSPLTDTARNAGWDARKLAERLQRIAADDRYARNKEEVASLIRGHLMFTVEVCQDLLDNFNQSED
ncbi:helix-turn-helix domain-containing protein [Curtobacterium sp. MCBD17_021]|uniref:helix-turn-helix domain-containing protein n=1 Tax=Curtobacterium sp. MCBD17_021 TaxID=2175665 RepID=UPI000DA8348D|nr:helix-turn-helix domain-containing protein [Curtobacterium sp. MCBD17_021]PZE66942.1 hypothetical protein DEI83_06430 [Curtobacterium sp. MCBD17_021]